MEAMAIGIAGVSVWPGRAVPAQAPGPSGASDERSLVAHAKDGDHRAFEHLHALHAGSVYGFVRMRVGDTDVAEEITQEVFVAAYRSLGRFEWQGSMAPWLLRIARNQVANHWRSTKRRPQLVRLPAEDDPDESMPEITEDDERMHAPDDFVLDLGEGQLDRALRQLTDLQQQVVALRFGAEMSLQETADVMGRSVNAVKNLQHKALGALRRQLHLMGAER